MLYLLMNHLYCSSSLDMSHSWGQCWAVKSMLWMHTTESSVDLCNDSSAKPVLAERMLTSVCSLVSSGSPWSYLLLGNGTIPLHCGCQKRKQNLLSLFLFSVFIYTWKTHAIISEERFCIFVSPLIPISFSFCDIEVDLWPDPISEKCSLNFSHNAIKISWYKISFALAIFIYRFYKLMF